MCWTVRLGYQYAEKTIFDVSVIRKKMHMQFTMYL